MKILVTGGAGYIGSHTAVELLQHGHELVIVDSLVNAKPDMVEKIQKLSGHELVFEKMDIRDREGMERVFSAHAFDAVIHFAGLKAVGESVAMPLEYYDNNLVGTLVLLETMQKHTVHRIVFSSSATVYGSNNPVPFVEEMPTDATNPYGYTKVVIERMLMGVATANPAFSAVLLRYFNPLGAHESGLIGEDPNGIPNNLVPYIAQVAAGKLPFLKITGDDYDTPDGTGVRDYIHVVDLAKGHMAAIDYAMAHTGAIPINLGTGVGYSVKEVLHAFEKACGKQLPSKICERRPGDIAECYAGTEKARQLLGWQAEKTLEEMCEDSWRFAQGRYK